MAATAVKAEDRKKGWLPYALGLSIAFHVALAAWIYTVRSPDILPPPMQRIIPVFIVPKKEALPPPPPPPKARQTGPERENPGGLSGQGMDRPAIPLHQPRPADPPPTALPPPVNSDPSAASLNPSAGKGDVPGPGAAATPGPGSGVGQGTGPGVGDGRERGGPAPAPPGWQPQWRRLPTRRELDRYYPSSAKARGIEGGALLVCTLGVTGRVTNCRVLRETPPGEGFGQAAVQLSRYFRIAPRRVNGRAVETELRIPYIMTLDAPPDAPVVTGGGPHNSGPIQAPPPRGPSRK